MAENTARNRPAWIGQKSLPHTRITPPPAAETRKLQTEWKRIGPAEFRDEKRFREDFAAACDTVFKSLGEHQAKIRERARPPAERNHDALLEQLAPRVGFLESWKSACSARSDPKNSPDSVRPSASKTGRNCPPKMILTPSNWAEGCRNCWKTETPADLEARATECEQRQRGECVQLEIHAGLNTPKEDQALRMELQLQQLASGFGKRGPDSRQLAGNLREAEVTLTLAGPLRPDARKELWERLRKLRQRISSRPPRTRTG